MTTVALLGDSQAGGIKEPLGDALRALGWRPVAAAHQNGASTRALITGPLEHALAPRPTVLVVFAGGNDLPEDGSATAWGDLVARARAVGARVIWVGPPAAVGDESLDARRLAISNAQARFFATKPDVRWISGRETAASIPRADEVHLTGAGYRTWADRLAPMMAGGGGSILLAIGIAGLVLWGAWRVAQRSSGFRGLEGAKFLLQIDDEAPVEVSSRDFFRDNAELDSQTKREIRKLKIGERTWGGGGAAVHWQIRRVG